MNAYNVVATGEGRWPEGLRLGSVVQKQDGWYFYPNFQRLPSRKGWPSAESAVKGRVATPYRLEPRA